MYMCVHPCVDTNTDIGKDMDVDTIKKEREAKSSSMLRTSPS